MCTTAANRDPNKIMRNGRSRAINVIGYPLATIVNVLQQADNASNAWFDVSFADDHEEAAYFVQEHWDGIVGHWEGTEQQLAFLRSFIEAFGE